ncbi:ribonuclease PH [Chloroflexia bacterium SDU3-3]|nr:ribonuclease PH [Chloroflexia bacterium SDU3-3]
MQRSDERAADQIRPLRITLDTFGYGEGSALIEQGGTRVLCTASVEAGVPGWLRGQGQGWVTGEYSLLPRSTTTRSRRERSGASGRTQEIQRLIGRSLRAAVDMQLLGEHTITIDCDVLQADGGTRCASITGGYLALALALHRMVRRGDLAQLPLVQAVAAISAGYVGGSALLDLDYSEDSTAEMDCNIIQTSTGGIVEVQCTAERRAVTRAELNSLLDLGEAGIATLLEAQRQALAGAGF